MGHTWLTFSPQLKFHQSLYNNPRLPLVSPWFPRWSLPNIWSFFSWKLHGNEEILVQRQVGCMFLTPLSDLPLAAISDYGQQVSYQRCIRGIHWKPRADITRRRKLWPSKYSLKVLEKSSRDKICCQAFWTTYFTTEIQQRAQNTSFFVQIDLFCFICSHFHFK